MKWRTVAVVGALAVAGCSDTELPAAEPAPTTTTAPALPTSTVTDTAVDPPASTDTSTPPTTAADLELPDLSGETLGLRGLGPVRIGASVDELAALGYEITYADCEVPYIRFEPNGVVAVRGGVHGDPSGGETLTGLYFWFPRPTGGGGRNRELRTHSGIGEGSTRADVLATYGDQVVERSVEVESYEPDVQAFEDRIEFVPRSPEDAALRMIFAFDDDGFLSGIRTGEAAAIHNPSLCA